MMLTHRIPDLFLIHAESIEDYVTMSASQNLHPIWKRLRPVNVPKACKDGLEKAQALYHLIHPVSDAHWDRYIVLRKAAEADFYGTLRATRHLSHLHPFMMQIRDGVSFVLKDVRLPAKQMFALADGIIPLSLNVTRSRQVRASMTSFIVGSSF